MNFENDLSFIALRDNVIKAREQMEICRKNEQGFCNKYYVHVLKTTPFNKNEFDMKFYEKNEGIVSRLSVEHEKAEKNLERARLELREYVSKRFKEEEEQAKKDTGEISESRSFRNSKNEE